MTGAKHPASDQSRRSADFLDLFRRLDEPGQRLIDKLLKNLLAKDYDAAEAIITEAIGPEQAAPIVAKLRR